MGKWTHWLNKGAAVVITVTGPSHMFELNTEQNNTDSESGGFHGQNFSSVRLRARIFQYI